MIKVAERLRELREDYELTRIEMAKRLGVNKSTITRYESGMMYPTIEMLVKIRETFGVTVDWLVGADTNGIDKYIPAIEECIKSGITPETLMLSVTALSNARKE